MQLLMQELGACVFFSFEMVHNSSPVLLCFCLVVCMSLVGEVDQLVDALTILRERAENDDPNALFSLCNDLSKAGSTKLMHSMSFDCEKLSSVQQTTYTH